MFLSLYIGQGAFCAQVNISQDSNSQKQGIDINNFKSAFKKKEKKQSAPKEIKLERRNTARYKYFFYFWRRRYIIDSKRNKNSKEKKQKNQEAIF